ncbi:MAG: hypothetical protein II075_03650 [Bacteroidales bacterium]|nr:hypothetical protein [Bacteroidales bacterium]
MAKKNFKGGLDSLIENSLGIKKSRKGEMKGNPVDLIKPEQTDDNDEVLAKPRTPKKPVQEVATPNNNVEATPTNVAPTTDNVAPTTDNVAPTTDNVATTTDDIATTTDDVDITTIDIDTTTDDVDTTESIEQPAPEPIKVSLESSDDDSTTIAYLKEVISDLRHELFLWRNGTINVQTFNATLHTHGLKYNPDNNEIEEFDAI